MDDACSNWPHTQGNTQNAGVVSGDSRSDPLQLCILLLRARDREENQLEVLGGQCPNQLGI